MSVTYSLNFFLEKKISIERFQNSLLKAQTEDFKLTFWGDSEEFPFNINSEGIWCVILEINHRATIEPIQLNVTYITPQNDRMAELIIVSTYLNDTIEMFLENRFEISREIIRLLPTMFPELVIIALDRDIDAVSSIDSKLIAFNNNRLNDSSFSTVGGILWKRENR